jgi:hypothetical protein
MSGLNASDALRAGVLGHGYVDDREIGRTVNLPDAGRADVDAIARFGEPLPQQSACEIVFLVYHNVHSGSVLLAGRPIGDGRQDNSPPGTSPGNFDLSTDPFQLKHLVRSRAGRVDGAEAAR